MVLLLTIAVSPQARAQEMFNKHFVDKTLRIDYFREGLHSFDTVLLHRYIVRDGWAGSLTQLVDPFDNGSYRVVVRDANTQKELYSKGYSTLFQEYRDTPEGKTQKVKYQEVVLIPYPLHAVDICFMKRDGSTMKMQQQAVFRFDPSSDKPAVSNAVKQPMPMKLHYSGDSHKKIDIAIVAEGYGVRDSAKMHADLQRFCQYTLACEPFKSRATDFNIWGVPFCGKESGITNPGKDLKVESAVGATYYTFGSERYIMTFELFQLHDLLGKVAYDHIIVMANSDKYGGGAIYNFYAVSSMNEMANMILPHELGHSIGGLADEYVDEEIAYSDIHRPDMEPVEPNITTLVDFETKWLDLVPKRTEIPTPYDPSVPRTENGPIGVYEGAGYSAREFYRPFMHCMMRDYAPFCLICSKRLNDIFDLYTK